MVSVAEVAQSSPRQKKDSPRIEPAHGMVTFQTTVHDGSITLLGNALLGDLGVDPVGEPPHIRTDLAKFNRGRGIVLDGIFEGLVEVAIVEEDIWVVVPAVEVTLNGLDRLNDTFQLLVSGEDNEGAVGSGLGGIGLETAFDKNLVVLFADFSGRRSALAGVQVLAIRTRSFCLFVWAGVLTGWRGAHPRASISCPASRDASQRGSG